MTRTRDEDNRGLVHGELPKQAEGRLPGPHCHWPSGDGIARETSVSSGRGLASIETVEELEERLSAPTDFVIEAMSRVEGDIMVLGVGGKMGPTLARMARRASELAGRARRIIGVSRFSSARVRESLESHGIETIACDLLDSHSIASLPKTENVIFMPAMKFGSTGREIDMWATNCCLPTVACQVFRDSRIVVFSTGNVYGLSPIALSGSVETATLNPVGEYAMTCLGRERVFQYHSQVLKIPVALLRLNYSCELRYGVFADLAEKVWQGQVIDLTMGYFNAIWQGDANAMALASLEKTASPPFVMNIAGPEQLSVRQVSSAFGKLFGKVVRFSGEEASDAILSNGELGYRLFGPPRHRAEELIQAVAAWIQRDGVLLGKPTRFESRDGKF